MTPEIRMVATSVNVGSGWMFSINDRPSVFFDEAWRQLRSEGLTEEEISDLLFVYT